MGNIRITFEYSTIRIKWFALVDVSDAFGIGNSKEESLADLVMTHKDLFSIIEFRVVLLSKEGDRVIA